mmetsp:Transcript_15513/g.26832  ORF Transcript_15513/g.26832 Transcript_15513/m.26832 type:complete len:164 (-) Transcript_15513:404-895(-)
MLEDYRILTQQIKLKNLIIACFIPPDYQDRIMQHCHWQDYEGTWSIDFLTHAGNAIRAHQDLLAAQEAEAQDSNGAETEKLQGVYFSYQMLEEEYAANASAAGTMGTITMGRGQRAGGQDPTQIGTLRDQVAYGDDDAKEDMPRSRGLVKDTVDPSLRKTGRA